MIPPPVAVTDPVHWWEPDRILAEPEAVVAVTSLGAALRAVGFTHRSGRVTVADAATGAVDLVRLALGRPTDGDVACAALGGERACAALVAAGGADVDASGAVALRFEVLSDGRAAAVLPFLPPTGDVPVDAVYAGSDTWLLRDLVWRFGVRGRRAVDLGTGTGLVAAFLTARFDLVVASDLSPRAVATARLGTYLLPVANRARLTFVTDDVAGGLRPGTFDLVCANAPWLPHERARGALHSDGGPTGFELPARFVRDGAELLAPGGVFVGLCADLVLADGGRPLSALAAELSAAGFVVTVEPVPDGTHSDLPAGLVGSRYVTVVVHRPADRAAAEG